MHRNVIRFAMLLSFLQPLSLPGRDGGIVLTEELKTPPLFGFPAKVRTVKTWLQGGHLRRDEGERSRTLLALSSGEAWLVNHRDSTVTPLSAETLQGLSLMGIGMFGIATDPVSGKPVIPEGLFRKTGRVRDVNGRSAEEYQIVSVFATESGTNARPASFWIGTDPHLDMTAYLSVLSRLLGPIASDYTPLFDQLRGLKGYPVLIQANLMDQELTQTLISSDSCSVDDAVFRLPDGYGRAIRKAGP